MVSSAHPLATQAGLEVLRAGGNAFDAAVAVAATLSVVEPHMSGPGGYGTIVVYDAKARAARFLNAGGRIPAGVDPDVFRAPTPNYLENRRGAKSVSTPGNVNAWEALWKTYGRLRWPRLFDSAIRAADEGFAISEQTARHLKEGFRSFPEHARAIYGRGGEPLTAGERLVQKDLAKSFKRISEQGARVLHGGGLGRAVDEAVREAGGFLTLADLKANQAEWWEPIRISYRGHEVVMPSPPANSFDALVRLGMMERFDPAALGHNSAAYLHRYAEVTKHGYWVRLKYAGDPDVSPPPLRRLLSSAYLDEEVGRIDLRRARPFVPPAAFDEERSQQHTTHFVVADRWGNVVSATQTLGNAFGSKLMPRGTGIWLNNSLAYSTFEPKGNPMDVHPGRRKLSGDCPTLVMRGGRPWVAIGTPGGHSIGQTVPQMVINLIDFRMDIREAISAGRISFILPDLIGVESSIPATVRHELAALGHEVRVANALGNAHGLTIEYDGRGRPMRFTGAADPRGDGAAGGY
jgi:gamma-glutamyltranspeptidase/glutathione hydrolase